MNLVFCCDGCGKQLTARASSVQLLESSPLGPNLNRIAFDVDATAFVPMDQRGKLDFSNTNVFCLQCVLEQAERDLGEEPSP